MIIWLYAVAFSAMNNLGNKSLDIRNYTCLIHLKDINSLQAIINYIYRSCGYVVSHVEVIMLNTKKCVMLLIFFVIGLNCFVFAKICCNAATKEC